MKKLRILLLITLSLSVSAVQASDDKLQVLATIHPLALLAASVVPAEQLQVLLPPTIDPHHFALKPSDIDQLQEADIILWGGPLAEPYLTGFVRRWPEKNWIDISSFASADQPVNAHYWLSVPVMTATQESLAEALGSSAGDFVDTMDKARQQIDALLTPLRERGFLVYHRAYDHWVSENHLNQLGSFTINPEQKPGLKTLSTLRGLIQEGSVTCIFYEPGVSAEMIRGFTGDHPVRLLELDPMGADISLIPDGYPYFMTELARRAASCLTGTDTTSLHTGGKG